MGSEWTGIMGCDAFVFSRCAVAVGIATDNVSVLSLGLDEVEVGDI